jgi:uncharacterized protein DUF6949
MVKDLTIALFALATGFTLSGIIANVYQLVTGKHEKLAETSSLALMMFAGPSLLLENAAASLRSRSCTIFAFWLAAAISAYWSFVLGLFVLNIVVVLQA